MFKNDMNQTVVPVNLEDRNLKLSFKHSRTTGLVSCIRKHWRVVLIAVVLSVVAVVVFYAIPVISINKTKITNLNANVTIQLDETVSVKSTRISAKIKHFTTDTCPKKGTCFGADIAAVEYELIVEGKKYATGSEVPAANSDYQIETITTDYKTYATIRIIKTTE